MQRQVSTTQAAQDIEEVEDVSALTQIEVLNITDDDEDWLEQESKKRKLPMPADAVSESRADESDFDRFDDLVAISWKKDRLHQHRLRWRSGGRIWQRTGDNPKSRPRGGVHAGGRDRRASPRTRVGPSGARRGLWHVRCEERACACPRDGRSSGPQRKVCRKQGGSCGQTTRQDGARADTKPMTPSTKPTCRRPFRISRRPWRCSSTNGSSTRATASGKPRQAKSSSSTLAPCRVLKCSRSALMRGCKWWTTMLEPRGGTEQREPGGETRGRPRGTKSKRTKWPNKWSERRLWLQSLQLSLRRRPPRCATSHRGLASSLGTLRRLTWGQVAHTPRPQWCQTHGPRTDVPLQKKANPRTKAPSRSRKGSVKLDPGQPHETWRREAWLTKLWTSMKRPLAGIEPRSAKSSWTWGQANCDEVWSVGKQVQKECNASKTKRNTRGTSTAECRVSDERRRRTSRRTSGTRWCTTARSMRRVCKNGQTRCSPRSREPSANLKLERASGWRQRTPAPNDAEHGRSSNQELSSSPYFSSLQRWQHDVRCHSSVSERHESLARADQIRIYVSSCLELLLSRMWHHRFCEPANLYLCCGGLCLTSRSSFSFRCWACATTHRWTNCVRADPSYPEADCGKLSIDLSGTLPRADRGANRGHSCSFDCEETVEAMWSSHVAHAAPTRVIDNVLPSPVIEHIAPAPSVTHITPSEQFSPAYNMMACAGIDLKCSVVHLLVSAPTTGAVTAVMLEEAACPTAVPSVMSRIGLRVTALFPSRTEWLTVRVRRRYWTHACLRFHRNHLSLWAISGQEMRHCPREWRRASYPWRISSSQSSSSSPLWAMWRMLVPTLLMRQRCLWEALSSMRWWLLHGSTTGRSSRQTL